jgi:hypothetical protein
MAAEPTTQATLDALQALLATARELLSDLSGDPLVKRVLRAFVMLPESDREPLLKVLEKDAAWRRIVEATERTTGITVRPNPHASLYVHVLEQATGQPVAPGPLPRDAEVIRLGIEVVLRILPLLFQEGVHAQWSAAAREIAAGADPETRRLAARLAQEVLELVAQAERDEQERSG